MSLPTLPPMRVPTLTEVVDWPPVPLVVLEVPAPAPAPAQAHEPVEDAVEVCADEAAELLTAELALEEPPTAETTTAETTTTEPDIAPPSDAALEPQHPLEISVMQEASAHDLPPPPPAPTIDEAALTQRLLVDLQQQVDSMLDHQLRVAMQPLLNRLADTLALQARDELASALRDMVALAVSRELIRLRAQAQPGEPG